jgi:D-arginine dehydrogenase
MPEKNGIMSPVFPKENMNDRNDFEIIIIGCGIAGASLAYFLTVRGVSDILILEREEQPGYHSTGRSAAVMAEIDLMPTALRMKLMSARFLREPPAGFSEVPLLEQSGVLAMYQGPMWESVLKIVPVLAKSGVTFDVLSPSEAAEKIPVVSPEHLDGAVYLPNDGILDVHALLWNYLRHAKRRGAELRCGVEVQGIRVMRGQRLGVVTSAGEFRARKAVNAAGAWAGQIAKRAGAASIELTPRRRTVITFGAPDDIEVRGWPFVFNHSHELYFAPESGGLLASPMDQGPVEPCDARPDELVVAQTIERIERLVPRLYPRSIKRKWAGLRTFAPDRDFVIGEDPLVKGFYWLAGQGGVGIATSPAVGEIAADLVMRGRTERIDANIFAPSRFGSRSAR